MQMIFSSEKSKDAIFTILIKKSHKALFKLKVVDDAFEHINLINKICNHFKKDDIKWIEITLNFSPKIPQNTIYFKNKFNGNFVCHIEDFEKFYLTNINLLVKLYHINTDPKISEDGWIKVFDPKKEKRDKYNKILKEFTNLVGDWNNMN